MNEVDARRDRATPYDVFRSIYLFGGCGEWGGGGKYILLCRKRVFLENSRRLKGARGGLNSLPSVVQNAPQRSVGRVRRSKRESDNALLV